MDFLIDWKFWLFVLTIFGIIINFLANWKLVNNDLHHIAIDIKEVQKDVKEISCKVQGIDKVQAVQEQRIKELEKSIN